MPGIITYDDPPSITIVYFCQVQIVAIGKRGAGQRASTFADLLHALQRQGIHTALPGTGRKNNRPGRII